MKEQIKQNLIAAGCDDAFIAKLESCLSDEKECARLLAAHRRRLLEEVHTKEQNISCLDYLVFTMQKEGLQ